LINELFLQTPNSLLEMFQEGGKADYLTWYMRVLTAGYLKRDPDRFLPFIEGLGAFFDIESFCKSEVEPMNKECEQIQIIALSEYLGITVEISYLDGRWGYNFSLFFC
jgi:ubiquitin thioesterase protein OTUB1